MLSDILYATRKHHEGVAEEEGWVSLLFLVDHLHVLFSVLCANTDSNEMVICEYTGSPSSHTRNLVRGH